MVVEDKPVLRERLTETIPLCAVAALYIKGEVTLMGDSGEGLVDAEARIQERMEEMQLERDRGKSPKSAKNPQLEREILSLKMARKQLEQQMKATTHEARRTQLTRAMDDVDTKIAALAAGR